jgi:hypothetical protein
MARAEDSGEGARSGAAPILGLDRMWYNRAALNAGGKTYAV